MICEITAGPFGGCCLSLRLWLNFLSLHPNPDGMGEAGGFCFFSRFLPPVLKSPSGISSPVPSAPSRSVGSSWGNPPERGGAPHARSGPGPNHLLAAGRVRRGCSGRAPRLGHGPTARLLTALLEHGSCRSSRTLLSVRYMSPSSLLQPR